VWVLTPGKDCRQPIEDDEAGDTALKQLALEGLRQELDEMRSLVTQVMKLASSVVTRAAISLYLRLHRLRY
jgi:hypothetical protein